MDYGDVRVDIFRGARVNVLASGECLPFRDGSFDLVFSRCVLEHMPNPLTAIKRQSRVCREGGKVFLITDNASFWAYHLLGQHTDPIVTGNRFREWRGDHPADRHFALFTPEHLRNLFQRAGLQIESIEFEDFGTKADWINRLLRVVMPRRFTYPRIRVVALKRTSSGYFRGEEKRHAVAGQKAGPRDGIAS